MNAITNPKRNVKVISGCEVAFAMCKWTLNGYDILKIMFAIYYW